MRYLVASKAAAGQLPEGCSLVACGEMVSFELPWTFGTPLVARIDDTIGAEKLRGAWPRHQRLHGRRAGGAGRRPGLRARRPYHARYGALQAVRGGGSGRGQELQRPLPRARRHGNAARGRFVPERVVLIEFPAAADALGFYISDRYPPLLKIRLATTDARLVILARSGDLPKQVRAAAEAYLRRVA